MSISCYAEEQHDKLIRPVYQSIGPLTASRLISEKEDLVIVDVRTPAERELAAIENSILIPVGQVVRGIFPLPKEQPILLYCAVGGRSFYAGRYLQFRGYQEIYNLDGGIEAWKKAGLTVIKGER